MTKDNNYSAEPVWDENDDLAEMMDAVLRALGLRSACLPNPDCSWAMFIGDDSFEIFSNAVDEYIRYYNNERIQRKTKWMPPVKYRIASMCSV